MLGTLDDLKGKLDIPVTDVSRDTALTLALETASARVLDLCRYSEADVTGKVQQYRNVQFNRDLFTDLRPIKLDAQGNPVEFLIEGRPLGTKAVQWSTLDGDLIDADEGRFTILGASSWWPPTRELQPAFKRWRDPLWPIIRVTYNVAGITSDPAARELVDGAASLAAFWYDRDLAGAKSEATIGQVAVKWVEEGLPHTLLEKLSKHVRHAGGSARWV